MGKGKDQIRYFEIFFRSRNGDPMWTQSEMQEFIDSDMFQHGTQKDARKALKQAAKDACELLRGASGKIPSQDLRRIWDSGASQGMTDRSKVSKHCFKPWQANYNFYR